MLAVGKIIPKSLQVGFANYMYLLLVCFDFVSDVSNIQAVSLYKKVCWVMWASWNDEALKDTTIK